jgi:D-3-phosphoglycerate dehydrogenase
MSEYRVLVSCPLIQDAIDEYADEFERHDADFDVVEVDQELSEAELLEVIDDYHGVIAGDDHFTEQVLRSADRLQVIAKWGIGIDNIDTEVAGEEGIQVLNTPGAFAPEVGDVVLGYAIMLTRRLHEVDARVREGDWYCPRGVSLAGRTMGVIGVGNIGSAVVRRAHAHGMDVVGHDVRELPADLVDETGIEPVPLEELLDRSDVVSLNCSLNEETRKMIGAAELQRLGQGGYLVNTARGQLVDQDALVDALENGTISGAALDVFDEEPLSSDSPLVDMDEVLLGSHNAQNTEEAVAAVNDKAVENVLSALGE